MIPIRRFFKQILFQDASPQKQKIDKFFIFAQGCLSGLAKAKGFAYPFTRNLS